MRASSHAFLANVAVFTAVVLVVFSWGCDRSPKHAARVAIEDLIKQNQLPKASAQVESSLKSYPNDADFLRLRVLILLKAERWDQAISALRALPANDPVLTEALHHHDPGIRAGAARLISDLSIPVAAGELIARLDDSDPRVRSFCARTLGHLRERSAVKPLFQLLHDDSWLVRAEAATALGRIDDPRSAGWLIRLLEDGDEYVRLAAAVALHDVTGDEDREVLLRAFQKASGERRVQIAIALAKIGEKTVLPILTNAVATADVPMRRRIAESLGDYRLAAVTNTLAILMTDTNATVREEADRSLKRVLRKTPGD
jgi:HEAT repeat protein